jgi:hypothetical protein
VPREKRHNRIFFGTRLSGFTDSFSEMLVFYLSFSAEGILLKQARNDLRSSVARELKAAAVLWSPGGKDRDV